ncbi:uncharacterized protein N7500_007871 [Penicillium coprophilum]|uniref:uncharacterized protein n=1 Tax=Penicillium coprophilum TaxID=36646 RepID=UPI0023914D47|nr:uncharacterized protein N7500_007871 [Penicillium coprophilum]KAJ5158220.1 hypothetical protein N7500_007871 [Penicillium coprophilum]
MALSKQSSSGVWYHNFGYSRDSPSPTGADQLSWPMAARTAMGMSMFSMLAMELAENAVDYHLTGGIVALGDPKFWMAAVVSVGAGYLAPLPYNYLRLRKYGKSCH